MRHPSLFGLAILMVLVLVFCGGNPAAAPGSNPSGASASTSDSACACTPQGSASDDYRHAEKHIPLPEGTPQEITVDEVLSWSFSNNPAPTAPRSGRELQLFHIAKAYVQSIYVVGEDCDLHFEVSATPDPNAKRIIIETPIDATYCPARKSLAADLKAKGYSFDSGTVPSIPVQIVGLAFEDYEHKRGSALVATPWELHPAVVTLLP